MTRVNVPIEMNEDLYDKMLPVSRTYARNLAPLMKDAS